MRVDSQCLELTRGMSIFILSHLEKRDVFGGAKCIFSAYNCIEKAIDMIKSDHDNQVSIRNILDLTRSHVEIMWTDTSWDDRIHDHLRASDLIHEGRKRDDRSLDADTSALRKCRRSSTLIILSRATRQKHQ